MINKTTSLHSTFSVNGEVSNDDTRFLNITIDVLHTGENLNGSIFTKKLLIHVLILSKTLLFWDI